MSPKRVLSAGIVIAPPGTNKGGLINPSGFYHQTQFKNKRKSSYAMENDN